MSITETLLNGAKRVWKQMSDGTHAEVMTLHSETPRLRVEPLGYAGLAWQLNAKTVSDDTTKKTLTPTVTRVTLYARGAPIRFTLGPGVAANPVNAATDKFIGEGERQDFCCVEGSQISVIRAAHATVDGVLEITELT